MQLNRQSLSIYFLISSLEGSIATFFLVQLPSEAENGLVFGLSLQRLLLVFFNSFLFLLFLIFSVYIWKHPKISTEIKKRLTQQKTGIILVISVLLTIIFTSLAFLIPEYRFSSFIGYVERLQPTILWFALISLQTTFFLFFTARIQFQKIKNKSPFFVFFSLFLLLWIFIAKSGLGIKPDDRYWNEASAPLLNEQIFISVIVCGILFFLISFVAIKKAPLHPFFAFIQKKQDSIIFIALWIIAAIIWTNEPLPKNFFAPGPYLPSNEFAPYADAATFDLGGQFSLIGQGLFNGVFYARALLSGFLALLHILFGQSYLSVITVQTVLFASLAPILYLIGKNLHSRIAGVFIAVLVIFKVKNAIAASTWILSVHPKYMLTEFPTAILLALFTLWLIKGLKEEKKRRYFLLLSGGALGLGIMLRTNILFVLPLSTFLFFIKFKTDWKKILRYTLILVFAFFVTISPWMWRNQKIANKPFFFLDIITEVIRTRYTAEITTPEKDDFLAAFLNLDLPADNKQVARLEPSFPPPLAKRYLQKTSPQHEISAFIFIPNHFFHNIVTSVVALPSSFMFHDLKHTIKEAYPYWSRIDGRWWKGELTLGAGITLSWSLFLLALGLSAIWKKGRVIGLIPLFVFLTYHVSNAFARTSGGRYLVPVDWVLLFYYAVGVVQLISFLMASLGLRTNTEDKDNLAFPKVQSFSYKKGMLLLFPFFFFVSVVTAIDQFTPQRYEKLSPNQIQERIIQNGYLEESPISSDELRAFMENSAAKAIMGRSLYPRFYTVGMGEHSAGKDAYEADKDFPRLAFTMISPSGQTGVVLPQADSPAYFPDAADVILVGCQHPKEGYIFPYIDALIVIVLDEDQAAVYTSNAENPLQCPGAE